MEKAFNRLKGLRAERGLTQVDMANLLGMNPVTYRKKENGERDFTLKEVAKAQEVLEIDPQYYFFINLVTKR
ncbi:helix-turn-helix transcriptional regulator [Enterococcus faecalis]|uniref:helix-turn-helix transcriptional regulator n=1 Tax=Enterococcus faecalis TaxID=1351 RepID=UPI0025B06988|nr:helix-turn-helix transcriptional regulator [Enterococcus faecalis]MDN3093770.1 helix-turn-helix transcriptional regulator [Enterococcus faecalis]